MTPTSTAVCTLARNLHLWPHVGRGEPYRTFVTATAACLAFLAAGCGGSTTTEITGPDLVRCATTVSPNSASVPADGGRVTITIDVARECGWTAGTDASWLQLSSTSGQGPETLVVVASPNPNSSVRSAGVVVNEQQLSLTQAARPCRFELEPSSVHIGSRGGEGSLEVTASDGCAWRPSTTASWVSFPDSVRMGSGTLNFEVAPNDGGPREATIRVGDQTFTILQGDQGSAPPPPGPGPAPAPGPPPPQPGVPAPTGLAQTVVSDTTVDLSWTNADPAAETQIYRNGAVVATKAPGVTSHRDTGLTRATNYTYFARHVKNGVVSPDSDSVVSRPVFAATGGTVSTAGGYRQHLFTSSGNFVVTQGGTIDEIIIIGGGGGGGGSEAGTEWGSGGGGAGGVRVITMKLESAGTYSVGIGSGGGGGRSTSSDPANNNGLRGSASSYAGATASGGGGGAGAGRNYLGNPGLNGGSGGGGSGASGGPGAPGEGNAGGAGFSNRGGAAGGGGGGGKGGAGSSANGGNGGAGGPGYSTWMGVVASGGSGGRGGGGRGNSGNAPGDGGQGNDPGGAGGRGANGAVLIRYRQ